VVQNGGRRRLRLQEEEVVAVVLPAGALVPDAEWFGLHLLR
jgi:hypothetical protein